MTGKPVLLITGAGGEIGHSLITRLADEGRYDVVALDLKPLASELTARCVETVVGDILETTILRDIADRYRIDGIFHLAALLSTRGEAIPEKAFEVNVKGTMNMLAVAEEQVRKHECNVKFLFPSSIAVYGIPDRSTKEMAGRVTEGEYLQPTTMYGVNKLACEHLGRYYAGYYRQLAEDRAAHHVDFRSVRFPGLISAETVPTGGTSDYVPEMLHAAAKDEPYTCFARRDTSIPFMTMHDATVALLELFAAPIAALTSTVYNVGSFAPSAGEVERKVKEAFPDADILYEVDTRRQAILDTWPMDVDDTRARNDWGWAPDYDFNRAFSEYLIPRITRRYVVQ